MEAIMVSYHIACTPLTLRISVTDRCDLRCRYCRPEHASAGYRSHETLTFGEIMRVVRAAHALSRNLTVRLTGGEPLLRNGIADFVAMLASEGIPDIALTTNGQRLAAMADSLKRAGLDRVNVSLDSLHAEQFSRLSRGGSLEKTIEGIHAALACGLTPVKLNTVVLRGFNDGEVCDLVHFAVKWGCAIRFIELMPIGEAVARHDEWYVPAGQIKERLSREFTFGDCHAQRGVPARTCIVRSRQTGVVGTVGFISSVSEPFCAGCGRLRLTSRGELIGCLMRNASVDVRSILRRGAGQRELEQVLRDVLAAKSLGRESCTQAIMATIGG
jgi:cyclic pyranopterin phosphate synthase